MDESTRSLDSSLVATSRIELPARIHLGTGAVTSYISESRLACMRRSNDDIWLVCISADR